MYKLNYTVYNSAFLKNQKGENCIAISKQVPKWFKGSHKSELSPSINMIKNLNNTSKEYKEEYINILKKVDLLEFLQNINDKVLVSFDADRHYKILYDFLKDLGYRVTFERIK